MVVKELITHQTEIDLYPFDQHAPESKEVDLFLFDDHLLQLQQDCLREDNVCMNQQWYGEDLIAAALSLKWWKTTNTSSGLTVSSIKSATNQTTTILRLNGVT